MSAGCRTADRTFFGALQNQLFERAFPHIFTFTILFEDCEVEERYFGVDEHASVLAISGAGCGVATMLARHPRRIDAVDSNRSHLALTALKVAAAQRLQSHPELYELLGHGRHPRPERTVQALTRELPSWIQDFWRERYAIFRSGLYGHGLLARLFRLLRAVAGTDAAWLRRRMREPVEQRVKVTVQALGAAVRWPAIAAVVNSPILLAAQGINFEQRDRNVKATRASSMVDVVVAFMSRAAATDLERNWIVWYAIAGHFNHECVDAVPPFLRPHHHQRSLKSPTRVSFHPRNVFQILGEAKRGTWSHYNLSDVIDWMPATVQRKLLDEVLRTSRDGGRLVYRTVEDACLVERLGLADRFKRIEPASTLGSAEDRSTLYRRVNMYEIQA